MNPSLDDEAAVFLVIAVIVALAFCRRRWRGSSTAFGTTQWMTEEAMRAAGMLGRCGLVVGRTFAGALIRLPDYCHVLVCGGTGSGKGVGIFIPNLLSYFSGSIICFDTKGDLYATTAKRRAALGEHIIRLAPFNNGNGTFNPLDVIACDSPLLVDSANAMATALVHSDGTEPDPHWNQKAIQVIRAVLVLVLLRFKGEDRNLSSVQEIVSDPDMLKAAGNRLQELGGIPARLGNQLKTLFDKDGSGLTKEGAGVLSTVTRDLSFLDSDLVAKAVATSTFDPRELRKPGITLFWQIPAEQLGAQKGLARCWTSAFISVIGEAGHEQAGEVLCLFDEASALDGLPALQEALVRGRSAGVRLVLAYQSPSQIESAFPHKRTLIYDNTDVQIQLGAPSGYEAAERLSKTIGDWTQVVESYAVNESYSCPQGGGSQQGGQATRGSSVTYSVSGRALRRPEELLQQSNDRVIVLQRGSFPILANRVKWYEDPEFNPAASKRWRKLSNRQLWIRIMLAALVGEILWAWATA
jgi:type IV secretion system protein VirD4